MSITNILVSYNGTDEAKRAVRLAAALARRYDAHLTGVFAHTLPYTNMQMEAYLTQAALDIAAEGARETEIQCEEDFTQIAAEEESGLRTSFFTIHGMPNDVFGRLARTHDLLVIGQPPEWPSAYSDPNPDDIAMRSGRPVLIAPRGFETFDAADGAVVAWDGQRAASRALADAMELLEDKHKITVLHVGEEREICKPGQDVMEHLSRHGLDAALKVHPKGGVSTSDAILNVCAEAEAGLLVMGAYEHSRFSEMILGGVTRDVVAKSHIPILMSH